MIAAFDYRCWAREQPSEGQRPRLLFVAHREELLQQSLRAFRDVLRDPNFGDLLVGGREPSQLNHLFVSIQSYMSRSLEELPADCYEYVVVDEFHHAAAPSYVRLLDHVRPRVLLGLTATPERSDGLDVLSYFGGHMSAQIRLPDAINRKLLRRHPHIFGEESAATAGDVKRIWSEVKAAEKAAQGRERESLLAGVPRILPALVEAQQITARAAQVGFDWENPEQVLDKLREELSELAEARRGGSPAELENEMGDLLFVLVNLARFVKVDPEQALRATNAKFRQRFGYIERKLAEHGKKPADATIDEMEALWQEAKQCQKATP